MLERVFDAGAAAAASSSEARQAAKNLAVAQDLGVDYMCPNCVTPWKCNGPHLSPGEAGSD